MATKENIYVAVATLDAQSPLCAHLEACGLVSLGGAEGASGEAESCLRFARTEKDDTDSIEDWVWVHEHATLAWIDARLEAGTRMILGAATADNLSIDRLRSHDATSWQVDFTFCAPDFDIEKAAEILLRILQQADCNSERDQKKLRVVALEALTNAWEHGYGGDEEGRIHVNYQVNTEGMHIEVSHRGLGFDPEKVPDPMTPENIFSESGRGILIMRNTLDHLEYRDGGRQLLGYKRFEKKSETCSDT